MTAELISVGTELLLGNIVNTNAAFLARECASLGLSLYYQTTVGDNPERLRAAVKQALERSDVVILSGGLGPTQDDLTKEITAEVFGKNLVEDIRTKERIQAYFDARGTGEIPENNWKQAMVPEGARVVDNENGTAPGLILEQEGKTAILLPGPPNELVPMFRKDIYPYLHRKLPETIVSEMVKLCGIGESRAEMMIADLIAAQSNPTIATYAKTGEVHLRVTARAENEDAAELLREQELTVTTVESCTGGLLAGRLVNVPGVSEVFKQGFVTYSNKAKRKLVGVKKTTLKEFGAVSDRTAREMAKGAILMTGSDAAVAVTGIAGPDGGSEEKPVGLVYIAAAVRGQTYVQECHFTGDRAKIRESSVAAALTLLRRGILETAEG